MMRTGSPRDVWLVSTGVEPARQMLSELNKEDYADTDKHMRPQTRPLPCSLPLPAQDSPQDGRAQRLQEHVDLSVDMHISRDSQPGGVLSVSLENRHAIHLRTGFSDPRNEVAPP